MIVPRSKWNLPILVRQEFVGGTLRQAYYVDAPRRAPQHLCLWEDYGLVEHERCKVCGLCREVPGSAGR